MRLQRFTWLELEPAAAAWLDATFAIDNIDVHLGPPHPVVTTKSGARIVHRQLIGEVPLSARPGTAGDTVFVPGADRLRAEAALEDVADLLSVGSGAVRALWSPNGFAIAFVPTSNQERRWLESHERLADSEIGVSRACWRPALGDWNLFAPLKDRRDGVTMLAEAVRHDHDVSLFRELVRFFERAFAASGPSLVPPMTEFLTMRPVFAFSKSEVKRWVVRLRGPAVHADRQKTLLREREMDWVTDRMLFAAYDVLLNKASWQEANAKRRDSWNPEYGPLDATTTIVVKDEPISYGAQLLDQFGSYKVSSTAPSFELDPPRWPRRKQPLVWKNKLKVVDREELEYTATPPLI